MNIRLLLPGLLASTLLLSACAGPSYWYEPPTGNQQSTVEGVWQGLARNASIVGYGWDSLGYPVTVRCAPYEDLIRLKVSGDKVAIDFGSDKSFALQAKLDATGHFQQQIGVKGDTWIYGGVMLFHPTPVLKLSGQLDPVRGVGQGTIAVTPDQGRIGCYGRFQVSRDSAAPHRAKGAEPFKIQYWIDEAGRDHDQLLWPK